MVDHVMKRIMFVTEEEYKNEFELRYNNNKHKKPDMREKIREYISELDTEIDRLERDLEKQMIFNVETTKVAITESRMKALIDVKTDLESRLMEDV